MILQEIADLKSSLDKIDKNSYAKRNSCEEMHCSTCGGVFRRIIDNADSKTTSQISSVLKSINVWALDEYFGRMGSVLSYFDDDGYTSVFIREAKNLNWSYIDSVDRFILRARGIYKCSGNDEFSSLYGAILTRAISEAVSSSNESLTETVILSLGYKTKDYPELLEYALSISQHDNQMKRVLYNALREYIDEVKDYSGDGSSFW